MVPFGLNILRVKLVTKTGSPPIALACSTMIVKFAPIDSGGAIFMSLVPNCIVTRVRRPLATSPLMAANEIFQDLYTRYKLQVNTRTISYPSAMKLPVVAPSCAVLIQGVPGAMDAIFPVISEPQNPFPQPPLSTTVLRDMSA